MIEIDGVFSGSFSTLFAFKVKWFKFQIKYLAGIFMTIAVIRAMKTGYFAGIKSYLKTLALRNYLLPLTLLVSTVLGVMFLFDVPLLHFLLSHEQAPVVRALKKFGALVGGNVEFWIVAAGGYVLLSLSPRLEKWAQIFFGGILTSIFTSLCIHIMKFVFLRARPYSAAGPLSFLNAAGLSENAHAYQSFASGDVAIVSGMAAYFFYALRRYSLRWILLLIPFTTALGRILDEKHWPSDTLFSFGFSLIVGHLVWNYKKHVIRNPSRHPDPPKAEKPCSAVAKPWLRRGEDQCVDSSPPRVVADQNDTEFF